MALRHFDVQYRIGTTNGHTSMGDCKIVAMAWPTTADVKTTLFRAGVTFDDLAPVTITEIPQNVIAQRARWANRGDDWAYNTLRLCVEQ